MTASGQQAEADSERKAFKDYFDVPLARRLGADIRATYPSFNTSAFVRDVSPGLDAMEFRDRQLRFAEALNAHLPKNYERALRVLTDTLEKPLPEDAGVMDQGYHLWPYSTFIEIHGPARANGKIDASMRAMHALTQRFTSEFAIRPFIAQCADEVLPYLRDWADDDSFHVRRLVSEGTRPRLPWGRKLNVFAPSFRAPIALLTRLKGDPSMYVAKSVANHLNDISKEDADVALSVAARWSKKATERTTWVVKHALRGLIRNGHPEAFSILGFGGAESMDVQHFGLDKKRVAVGGACGVTLSLTNLTNARCPVIVDYRVTSPGKGERHIAKVWKWTQAEIEPRATVDLERTHRFRNTTTRQVHPGTHQFELIVNGSVLASAAITVRES